MSKLSSRYLIYMIIAILVTMSLLILPACSKAAPPPAGSAAPTTGTSASPAAATQIYKWRITTFAPPSMSLYSKGLMKLVEMIKEDTDGQVILEPYPAAAIVPVAQMFESCASGTLDAIYSVGQYEVGIWPFGIQDSLPLSFSDVRDQRAFMWGDYQWTTPFTDFIRPQYAKRGIYYLTPTWSDMMCLISRKPLNTVEEFKGYKVRAVGLLGKWFSKLGATVSMAPLAETYTGLSTGNFDGVATGIGGFVGNKLYEQAKYLIWPPINGFVAYIGVSNKSWEKLPPNLQKIVRLSATNWSNWEGWVEWYSANYTDGIDLLKTKGVQTYEFKDMAKAYEAAMSIWDEVAAADADAAKGIEMVKQFMKVKKLAK